MNGVGDELKGGGGGGGKRQQHANEQANMLGPLQCPDSRALVDAIGSAACRRWVPMLRCVRDTQPDATR